MSWAAKAAGAAPRLVTIHVEGLTGAVMGDIKLPQTATVLAAKKALEGPTGTPAQFQKLLKSGDDGELQNSQKLQDAGVTEGSRLLFLRLHPEGVLDDLLLEACRWKPGDPNRMLPERAGPSDCGVLVRYLLKLQADPNCTYEWHMVDRRTLDPLESVAKPIHIAARSCNASALKALLEDPRTEADARCNYVMRQPSGPMEGEAEADCTSLHIAANSHGPAALATIRTLLDSEKFTAVHAKTGSGATAWQIAEHPFKFLAYNEAQEYYSPDMGDYRSSCNAPKVRKERSAWMEALRKFWPPEIAEQKAKAVLGHDLLREVLRGDAGCTEAAFGVEEAGGEEGTWKEVAAKSTKKKATARAEGSGC